MIWDLEQYHDKTAVLDEYGMSMTYDALARESCRVAEAMGRRCLRLRCAPDNAPAQRFYRRYGFYCIGEAPGSRAPVDLLEKKI